MPSLAIIIPTLNEAAHIADCLAALQPLRARGVEIIVVDGGSEDATLALARPLCDKIVPSAPGRAAQMNAGCEYSQAAVLLFLHADSMLPKAADELILQGLAASGRQWGRFDVVIEGDHALLPMVSWFMNWRSRLTGIATGDQGLFATRKAFAAAGGFANIRLMEDIALCKRLKRLGPPLCLDERITTSGRRWDRFGLWQTIFLMWRLRLAYFLGADPNQLAQRYRGS